MLNEMKHLVYALLLDSSLALGMTIGENGSIKTNLTLHKNHISR